MKRWIRTLAAQAGYTLFNTRNRYAQDGLFTAHSDRFRVDPAFKLAYARGVQASNGFDPAIEWRVHIALWAAGIGLNVAGDFVECGVNAGFVSSAILQRHKLDRRFFLIDTFSGPVLTQYSQAEIAAGRVKVAEAALAAGSYVSDLDRVRANYAEWPNAVIVQGAVPDVLATVDFGRVSFLHIDMNCAYPEKAALEFFWDRLSRGAVVLFDDYGYLGHDEQWHAIDEVVRRLGAQTLSLPTGQGILIKP